MELKVLQQEFAVCKVKELSECDLRGEFCFVGIQRPDRFGKLLILD